jgi:mRNA interferase RelE/StbE
VTAPGWRLTVAAPAQRQLAARPPKVYFAILDTLEAIEANPHRLGGPLKFELAGYRSARRGTYRIVYRVDDVARRVFVVAIAHRTHVYRPGR